MSLTTSTTTTTTRRPPSTVVGPRAIVLNESPSVTPSGSYSAANSNGVTVNIIAIGVGFVGGALLLIALTLLTRLHLARRRAAAQGLPRPHLWDVVFDSSLSSRGAAAIGRSLGGYDWDYRGDIWGARGLGLGGIWGFGIGGVAGEKEGEGLGRKPEMREVLLGNVGGKSGGEGDVRGFGGWKPTSLFLHEPLTTAATTTITTSPSNPPSAPTSSNPAPLAPAPSNPSSSSTPSSPLELQPDSRISTTVLILLPSPKHPYTGNSAHAGAVTPEIKVDGHGQLRVKGERDEKKKKYEVRHVEDVHTNDAEEVYGQDGSGIQDAGDAWGRVMEWGEGRDAEGDADGRFRTGSGTGLAGTLSLSGPPAGQEMREKPGVQMPMQETDGGERSSTQAVSSSALPSGTPTPTKTQPQGITSEVYDEEEEEDDLPDFVLGVLELQVTADTPEGEVANPSDHAEGGVLYPPETAGSVPGPGQPVSGVSAQTLTEGSATATAANTAGRERPMPSDGLIRSFWRR